MTSAEKKTSTPKQQRKRLRKNIKIKWNDLRAHNHTQMYSSHTYAPTLYISCARACVCVYVYTLCCTVCVPFLSVGFLRLLLLLRLCVCAGACFFCHALLLTNRFDGRCGFRFYIKYTQNSEEIGLATETTFGAICDCCLCYWFGNCAVLECSTSCWKIKI